MTGVFGEAVTEFPAEKPFFQAGFEIKRHEDNTKCDDASQFAQR